MKFEQFSKRNLIVINNLRFLWPTLLKSKTYVSLKYIKTIICQVYTHSGEVNDECKILFQL